MGGFDGVGFGSVLWRWQWLSGSGHGRPRSLALARGLPCLYASFLLKNSEPLVMCCEPSFLLALVEDNP